MKSPLLVALTMMAALGGGCQSGDITARNDYSSAEFESYASRRAVREEEIRKFYTGLTDEQIQQKLDVEVPMGPGVTRQQSQKRAAQKAFAEELAASREQR